MQDFLAFARRLIALRQAHPALRQACFLHGRDLAAGDGKDVTWLASDGQEMGERHWHDPDNRCFGLMLAGDAETLLLLANARDQAAAFALPPGEWSPLLDTAAPDGIGLVASDVLPLASHSLVLLRAAAHDQESCASRTS